MTGTSLYVWEFEEIRFGCEKNPHILWIFLTKKRLNFYRHKKEVTKEDEKYRKLFKLSLNLTRNFQVGYIHFLLMQLANFLVELPFKETYLNSQTRNKCSSYKLISDERLIEYPRLSLKLDRTRWTFCPKHKIRVVSWPTQ